MTERPNICYIFEKLSVQGCQIWHSHVPMSFNSASTHSTHPHNAKKALYVIVSTEIPENFIHKSCCIKVIFDDVAIFFFSLPSGPRTWLSQIVANPKNILMMRRVGLSQLRQSFKWQRLWILFCHFAVEAEFWVEVEFSYLSIIFTISGHGFQNATPRWKIRSCSSGHGLQSVLTALKFHSRWRNSASRSL